MSALDDLRAEMDRLDDEVIELLVLRQRHVGLAAT